jgi:tetratricopeptide (TPR) repeat protein
LSGRNQAVVDFVSTMLTEVAPPEEPIRVADLLDRSVAMLAAGGSNPEHEAAILGTLATYFSSAGDKPMRAKELLDKSLELTRASEDQALRGNLLCDSAYAAQMAGRTREAAAAVEEGLRLTAHDNFAAAKCLGIRAGIARASSDPDGLLMYAQQALARLQSYPIAQPAEEASYLDMIAAAYAARGRTDEADRNFAASIEKLAEAGRAESPRAGVIRNNWAVASYAAGDYRQAIANYDEALRIGQRWSIGGQAPAFLLSNRAKTLRELARYPEALEGFDRAIESAKESGYANMRVDALVNRASTYLVMGDLARAEQAMAQAKADPGAAIDPNSPTGVSLKTVQARIDAAHGDLVGAITSLSSVIESFDSRKIVNGSLTGYLRQRADMYLQQGNLDAAMADARRAVQMSRSLQGAKAQSSLTGLALLAAARVHQSRGEAVEARKAAAEAVTHLTNTLGDEHPETQRARRVAEV